MTPHSIGTIEISDPRPTPAQRAQERRTAKFKGEVLPETTGPARDRDGKVICQRVKVADLPEGHLKQTWIEHLEHNQKIASCCRHPEDHEVEALTSHPSEPAPDIYIFHCHCGRKHRFVCMGRTDFRPIWSV